MKQRTTDKRLELCAAAKRDADGYSGALQRKGWTKDRAEAHPLVAGLRRVAERFAKEA